MVAAEKGHSKRVAPPGYQYVPADGKFGWMVCAGAAIAYGFAAVPLSTFGLIFADILYDMDTTTSTASWIPAICMSFSLLIAPIVNVVIVKYSCRMATIAGGFLAFLGMIFSYFAGNVVVLFFTFGVIYGCGLGFVGSAVILVLGDYFRDHYGLATGITFAFYSSSKLIFSPLAQMTLEFTDYRGLILIMSALCLNVCVGGALFQPGHWHHKLVPIAKPDSDENKSENGVSQKNGVTKIQNGDGQETKFTDITNESKLGSSDIVKHRSGSVAELIADGRARSYSLNAPQDAESAISLLNRSKMDNGQTVSRRNVNLASSWDIFGSVQTVVVEEEEKENELVPEKKVEESKEDGGCYDWWKNGPMKLDVSLLTEPIFHVIMWAGMLAVLTSVYQPVYLPSLMIENGLLPMQAASVLSFKAGGEIAGRIAAPFAQEQFKLPLLPMFLGFQLIQTVLLILFTVMPNYGSMIAAGLISGMVTGGYTGVVMKIIANSVGYGRLKSIFALTKFLQGFLTVGVGPLLGAFKDLAGDFDVCFYGLAVIQLLSTAIWSLQQLAKRKSFLT